MTTFKKRPLCSLAYTSENHTYEENLALLCECIVNLPKDVIVVLPELSFTNFDYDNFSVAAAFSKEITTRLCALAEEQIIVATMIEVREDGGFYNVAKVFHRGTVVHKQAKVELFKFGGEHEFFKAGREEEVAVFEVDGIRFGVLICFEIRFKKLLQKLEGAEVLLIPAQWGKLRTQNFVSLTNAIAIMNQCYVVASDTKNSDTTGMSGIITPFGEEVRNKDALVLEGIYDEKEVLKMRRYLDVGIK